MAHDQEKHSISTQKHPTNLHFHKVMIENPAILKTTKGWFSEKKVPQDKGVKTYQKTYDIHSVMS